MTTVTILNQLPCRQETLVQNNSHSNMTYHENIMTFRRTLFLVLLLMTQSAMSQADDFDQQLLRGFLASNEDRNMQNIISQSDRKIAKKKLSRIVQTIRKREKGRILGIKRNSKGYAVRLIHNGRIRVLQVDQDGASILW